MLPPRAILVGIDFSEASRPALACAARLARQCGATLHVMHAQDPLLHEAAERSGLDLTADTHEELQRFVDATPPAASCNPCRDVVTGAAVTAILHIANREGADLIVVGAHGQSGVERVLFGSVAAGVLLRADRSVLVMPPGWAPPRPETDTLAGLGPVVVGVDFSAASFEAVTVACRLAERLETSVEAVHIVPTLPVLERWRPHAEQVMSDRTDIARRDLAALAGTVSTSVRLTTHVDSGDVAEQLASAAAPLGSRHPLLVLGRYSTRSRDHVPGSVAYRVATLVRVPVLMHREPAESA